MTLRSPRSAVLAVAFAAASAAPTSQTGPAQTGPAPTGPAPTTPAPAPPDQDAARAAWRYRRPVVLPAGAGDGRFVAVAIPPEVAEHSQPALADLRIVSDDGREVPYVLDIDVPRTAERRRSGSLVEAKAAHGAKLGVQAWVVDFETATAFDHLELDIDATDFSKRLEIETSLDGARWTRVPGEAWVFDRPWRGRRIHDTTLEQPTPLTARYLRLTIVDWRSEALTIRGATAVLTSHLGGRRWTRNAPLVRLDTPPGEPSRYRVDIPAGAPVERIAIASDDVAFWRDVRVFESGPRGTVEPVSGRETIYRVRLDDADLDAERLDVDLARPVAAPLIIEVEDGDSPPLARPRVTLSGMERRALVPATSTGLTLYYGNAATRRPVYDLEALRSRLSLVESYPQATLGPEAGNPRFVPLAPMAFLAARGAAAETSRWTVARQLRITGGDDVYTLTLAAGDLIYLRPDLGDIRLVDREGRQVPYVLEPRAAAARVALTVQPSTPRDNAPRTSAWQLTVPSTVPDAAYQPSLSLAGLELFFADGFYTRPAVLLMPDRRSPHGQRVLQQGTLRASRRASAGPPDAQAFELDDLRTAALGLEVANGDNAPLTLQRADAVVWVPRLTFKAAAGEYRLLFGNPEAAAPTYDLADLRQDVLAYSAIPIESSALQPPTPNADYARGARDVLSSLERGPLLWTALAFSIVALLWLTKVILKSPPSPPTPPTA
jgi:hypothetical protein